MWFWFVGTNADTRHDEDEEAMAAAETSARDEDEDFMVVVLTDYASLRMIIRKNEQCQMDTAA